MIFRSSKIVVEDTTLSFRTTFTKVMRVLEVEGQYINLETKGLFVYSFWKLLFVLKNKMNKENRKNKFDYLFFFF